VVKWQHDRLKVFGIGADQPAAYWRGVIRQLIAHGAIAVEMGEFSTLRLDEERARPILRGEQTLMLRHDSSIVKERRPARTRGEPVAILTAVPIGADAPLFERLRAWRLAEAKAQGVPPYVIFHDSVLREIAAVRPDSMAVLARIKGVGASKLERYGALVLAAVEG
jgi:ATP-dependent DNA helicase RecQ